MSLMTDKKEFLLSTVVEISSFVLFRVVGEP